MLVPSARETTGLVAAVCAWRIGGLIGVNMGNIRLFRQILPMFTPISPPIRYAQTSTAYAILSIASGNLNSSSYLIESLLTLRGVEVPAHHVTDEQSNRSAIENNHFRPIPWTHHGLSRYVGEDEAL